jgi:predicted dehydrogenase
MIQPYGIGIIGCGSIGQKRAKVLSPGGELIACADKDFSKAQSFADQYHAMAIPDWHELIQIPEINIVIIATTHDSLAEITLAAIQADKHVFVEKPAARSHHELESLLSILKQTSVKVRVGYNHRYHRAIQKAKQFCDEGLLGPLLFIRAKYGHGGRLGYENEWRSDPKLSGGGQLIDQGSHLIDLARWFLGDFTDIQGFAHTYYWDRPVEDNGFMLLKTSSQQAAFLHASCTEWKNTFSLEIYGKLGKLEISGLGGSYGTEKLIHYHMLPEMGPPETTIWEYPMEDDSWACELNTFYDDIRLNRDPSPHLQDAYAVLKIIHTIYQGCGYDYCA